MPHPAQPAAREVLDVARRASAPWGQAFGLRRGDPGFMVSGDQVGHAGFTGTSFVVDLAAGLGTQEGR